MLELTTDVRYGLFPEGIGFITLRDFYLISAPI